jgi:hypothetical protein
MRTLVRSLYARLGLGHPWGKPSYVDSYLKRFAAERALSHLGYLEQLQCGEWVTQRAWSFLRFDPDALPSAGQTGAGVRK